MAREGPVRAERTSHELPKSLVPCQGDNQADFSSIINTHKGRVLKICRAMARNRDIAEELCQETFIKVSLGLSGYRGESLVAWVSQIARRVCLDHLRKTAVELTGRQTYETRLDQPPALRGEQTPGPELAAIVNSVLDQLKPEQRSVLKLFYGHGYTANEIQELTGLSANQVKSHIQNGRALFLKRWEQTSERTKNG